MLGMSYVKCNMVLETTRGESFNNQLSRSNLFVQHHLSGNVLYKVLNNIKTPLKRNNIKTIITI